MRLLGTHILDDFLCVQPQCRAPLVAWRNEVEEARWQDAEDLLLSDLIAQHDEAANSVVFNVIPRLCLVKTRVNFSRGLLLVTRAWIEESNKRRRRRAA